MGIIRSKFYFDVTYWKFHVFNFVKCATFHFHKDLFRSELSRNANVIIQGTQKTYFIFTLMWFLIFYGRN